MNAVLVATDGSPSGSAAVDKGLELAARLGVGLIFVSVHRPPPPILDPFYERSVRQSLRTTHAVVEDALDRAAAFAVPADGEIIEGDAADEIVALADNRDAGLIVIGSCSGGPLLRSPLGSVSAAVVQHARRPVVIVDPGPNGDRRPIRAA